MTPRATTPPHRPTPAAVPDPAVPDSPAPHSTLPDPGIPAASAPVQRPGTRTRSGPRPRTGAAAPPPRLGSAEPRLAAGAGELATALCRDGEHFAALAGEWEDLRRRCRAATPFQSHAWLYSWWQSYGRHGRLRIVLVREGGRLVAAAPLMLRHRPLPTLVTLGGGISDYQDVLLDDGCARAAGALAGALHALARGAVLDLREARPGSAAERVRAEWPGAARELEDSVCLELPGVPMDALLRRLPTGTARHSRRKLRRIDALGVEERQVEPAGVPEAVRTMLRLHQRQWSGRGITPEHLRPRFAAHLVCATRLLADCGDAAVTEYRLDGEVVACDIAFTSADRICGYLYGADPRLRERKVDITTMLLRHDARYASATGRGTVSLLRGTEAHKLRWRPVPVTNRRHVLARRELSAAVALVAALTAVRAHAAAGARNARRAAPLPGGLVRRGRGRCRARLARYVRHFTGRGRGGGGGRGHRSGRARRADGGRP